VAGIERLVTHKGQTLTVTGRRTGGVTQQLVIPLWTLRPVVTQVVAMETHTGRSATVVTRTRDIIAQFVFASRTVLDPITPDVDRKAERIVAGTTKVGDRTVSCGVKCLLQVLTTRIHVDDERPGFSMTPKMPLA
jgi:hypothetical protein